MADLSNLELWNRFFRPPLEACKKKDGGGFACTAIDSMWRVRAATELFGPCGVGWGYEVVEDGVIEGAPILDGKGQPGHEKVHWCRIRLWYEWGGKRGVLEHYGQTTLTGTYGKGEKAYFFTDEEAPKKSLTDALGKALSMLGIGGSVYMGMFDADKYVQKPRAASARRVGRDPDEEPPTGDHFYDSLHYVNQKAKTTVALDLCAKRLKENEKLPPNDPKKLTAEQRIVLDGAIKKRQEELANAQNTQN